MFSGQSSNPQFTIGSQNAHEKGQGHNNGQINKNGLRCWRETDTDQ